MAALISVPVYADDIFKGRRGPLDKNWQVDCRISHSEGGGTETTTGNAILKYWRGDKSGVWGFVNLPFKHAETTGKSENGLGNVTVGMGPRGRIGGLSFLPYGAISFPSGSAVGSSRYDKKAGIYATYMAAKDRFELDGGLEYNFTGRERGSSVPDEIYAGALAGCRLSNNIRIATGLTHSDKGEKNMTSSRTVLRYTPSPRMHFEVVGDAGLRSRGIPRQFGIGFYHRYNF